MKTNKIVIILVIILAFTSCFDSFLDLAPLDKQNEDIFFKTKAHFEEAANKLHPDVFAFRANNETFVLQHDYGTDLLSSLDEPTVSGTNSAPTADLYWRLTYEWLRPVNIIIAKGNEYSGNKDEIAGPVGQAYFFRAWHHFFLLRRFGGVPISNVVADVSSEVVIGPRASRYHVIKQILDDLDMAIEKLANTTKASTGNDGRVTIEAAMALKARVCLYEATWEKYVGDKTDGDGVVSGAGSAKPNGYPSVTDMLNMAKSLSKEIIESQTFQLWTGVEDVRHIASVRNPEMYDNTSYYYLFNLEGATSNPAGLTKASNNEAIFRTVYDAANRRSGQNVSHSRPGTMSRKLADMYLCTDGLPVHLSPLFGGYIDINKELENRDHRFTACFTGALTYRWGFGKDGNGAQYNVDIQTLPVASYLEIPNLRNGGPGMSGRKWRSELTTVVTDGDEAMDYMHIRFAEMYLIYAEATCELGNGDISDEDLDFSINHLRARGGVAPLNAALIAYANSLGGQLDMMGEIRRERALELYGEGHRVHDLCRWGIAEAELAGQPRCGAYLEYEGNDTYLKTMINPIDNNPVYEPSSYAGKILASGFEYTYKGLTPVKAGAIIVEQAANRIFALKNYLQPIPTDQIKLNPELKQNPGW